MPVKSCTTDAKPEQVLDTVRTFNKLFSLVLRDPELYKKLELTKEEIEYMALAGDITCYLLHHKHPTFFGEFTQSIHTRMEKNGCFINLTPENN